MQLRESKELRQKWGEKPHDCRKNNLVKEFHHGNPTGDYVCPICGRTYWNKQIDDSSQAKKDS